MVLVFHLTVQDHVIKDSSDFMGGCPCRRINILPSLMVIGTYVMEI